MSKFFTEVDALGMAEVHAQRVVDLEKERGEKLLEVYERAARRIRIRLSKLPPDIYTTQYLRGVLIQLDGAMVALEAELQDEMQTSIRELVRQGTRDTAEEINKFNEVFRGAVIPINLESQLAALNEDNYLFNQFDTSVKTYGADLRGKLAFNLQQMLAEGATTEQMIDRLLEQRGIERFFEGESWRLRRIVRTELHNVYGQAKQSHLERIVASHAPDMMKTLYHPLDGRTASDSQLVLMACIRAEKQKNPANPVTTQDAQFGEISEARVITAVADPFAYRLRYKRADGTLSAPTERIFMHPPDRPNDRSILIPYHPSWGS